MALGRSETTKLKGFVDQYMSHYTRLRSDGFSCEDAARSIYTLYAEKAERKWDELSLESQIEHWSTLTFADHIRDFHPSHSEEERIVTGLLNALPVVCPKSKSVLRECGEWVREYLKKEYKMNI